MGIFEIKIVFHYKKKMFISLLLFLNYFLDKNKKICILLKNNLYFKVLEMKIEGGPTTFFEIKGGADKKVWKTLL